MESAKKNFVAYNNTLINEQNSTIVIKYDEITSAEEGGQRRRKDSLQLYKGHWYWLMFFILSLSLSLNIVMSGLVFILFTF